MLECSDFHDLRNKYLPRDLFTSPNIIKFQKVMSANDNDRDLLPKVAKYCKILLKTFREVDN